MVDEPDDSLAALCHAEGRTRRLTVIPNKSGLPKVGVHLLEQRLDLNLIIVDRTSGRRTSKCPVCWLSLNVEDIHNPDK